MNNVAIVIVNYNAGAWLARCIAAALQYSDANVYVVDNHSVDLSVSLAQQRFVDEPRLHWYLNSVNKGFAAANNQVLNAILQNELSADYVVLLNPDCEINQNTIPTILAQFTKQPKLGLASCLIYNEDGSIQNTYFMHCEDLDWCMRFAQQGWQVGFVPAASVMHAKGVSSASRPIGVLWTLHRGMNRFFDRFYREQYSLPIRLLVKTGIYVSFAMRAFKPLLQPFFCFAFVGKRHKS